MPDLVRRVRVGDIDPQELWIAGSIVDSEEMADEIEELTQLGVNTFGGVMAGVSDLIRQIQIDLKLRELANA